MCGIVECAQEEKPDAEHLSGAPTGIHAACGLQMGIGGS